MAECDMSQRSVTLTKGRQNHQKYKKSKWNAKREMEQRSTGGGGGGGNDVTQYLTAANREYDITFDCEIWRGIPE